MLGDVPHHHAQRVSGTEPLTKRLLGFEQMMVSDLDEGKVGHNYLYHRWSSRRSLYRDHHAHKKFMFSGNLWSRYALTRFDCAVAPLSAAGLRDHRVILNHKSLNSIFQISHIKVDQEAEA